MSTALQQRLANPVARLSRSKQTLLRMFRNGVGRDLNPNEFDEATMWCEMFGANPIANDIYFFVFDKDKPDKRRMVPVLSINLYRKTAARSGNYRPDDRPARFTYDEKLIGPANPKGIVNCEVTVYRHAHGEWHPITTRLSWDERAPLVTEQWEGPKGSRRKVELDTPVLDPSKPNWRTMPETMLAKCCEADAIRKGWPEEMSGTYSDGELDRSDVLDLTPSEVLYASEQEDRRARIGGVGIIFDWCNGDPLEAVPPGQVADRVIAWMREHDADRLALFRDRNRHALKQFWAHSPGDALEIKKAMEARRG